VKRCGKRLVLDGAELVLRRGEVVALVGENGAGKTSLLCICAGVLPADAGTVERRGLFLSEVASIEYAGDLTGVVNSPQGRRLRHVEA
jgi:ABC-type sugar transport system ATPase subunit